MDNQQESPPHFTCPISLEIMKDPVTTPAGITYDRQSIERWLFTDRRLTCPITNQPLPSNSDLIPNHTLRRLIQSWPPIHATPRPLTDLATARNLLSFLPTASTSSADSALSLLLSLNVPHDDLKPFVSDNYELVHVLTPLIHRSSPAILFLKTVFELATPKLLGRLRVETFDAIVGIINPISIIKKPADDLGALDAFISIVTGPPGPNPISLMPTITIPVLLLWGDVDPFTPIDGPVGKYFSSLPSHLSNVSLYLLEGVGHCPHDDRPDLVHEKLLPWLAALPAI